jgi:hypothetical protein
MESSTAEFLTRWCASEQLPMPRCRHWQPHFTGQHDYGVPRCSGLGATPQTLSDQEAYLLGLLAMIKCSICSYQCDN